MNPYTGLFSAWGLVTVTLVALLIYRSRLTSHESDWIPLTDDAKEDRAIQNQIAIEKKTHKLTWPIRGLFALSVLLLVATLCYWIYDMIMTPPAA